MVLSKLTTFYIVRHGQTDWNKSGHLQGHTDIPLNETGRQQAKELANTLKHIHFDEIFSSDLSRSIETAKAVAIERNIVVKTAKALREKSYGNYEGKIRKEIDQELQHLFQQREKLATDEEKMKLKMYEGGESDGIDFFINETYQIELKGKP